MAPNAVLFRYAVLVVLVLFGFVFYLNVNDYLFKNATNFQVTRERDTLLDVLRNMGKSNQRSNEPLGNSNTDEIHNVPSSYTTTNAVTEQNHSDIHINESDSSETLVNRRVEFTRKVCEERQFTNFYTEFKFKDIGHMIVDDKHKLVFCYIPKVACSTWKQVLRSVYNTHHTGYRLLHQYSPEDIKYRLKNYRKAMFVRDPITRFLSAFLHKFYTARENTVHIWERSYGRSMIEEYRPWMDIEKGQTGLNITVSEFIKYIVNLGEDYGIDPLRDHWLPMYRSCDPCKFQPDFIGHFENLEDEGPYLLEWLGVGDVHFPEYHASDAADKLVKSYSQAEMGLMRALRSYYHRDYELFNYSANETMRKVLFGE